MDMVFSGETGFIDSNNFQFIFFYFFFSVVLRPKAGHGLLILEVSSSHTMT